MTIEVSHLNFLNLGRLGNISVKSEADALLASTSHSAINICFANALELDEERTFSLNLASSMVAIA